MPDLKMIADKADVIIAGYAMTRCGEGISVFNLNNAVGAAVFGVDGILTETNMDDIELAIAKDYMLSGLKYMEHYKEMYQRWSEYSDNGFYRGE